MGSEVEKILKSSDKFKINLGLERIKKALEIFNNPQRGMEFIHVAGTNGKGSVCAILEKILLEENRFVVGKYTSPHLFSYTERFSVNGENIKEDEFQEICEEIFKKDKKYNLDLTEFEILTLVAFIYFQRKNVQIAILETGLGGRYDATNVIEKPLISIITSISYDHKERLGNTIEEIAYEKAGIIKENCKVLFLKENSGYKTLLKCANEKNSIIIQDNLDVKVENGFAIINNEKFQFNLKGDFQAENLKLALLCANELFKPDKETLKKSLLNVDWKFRMQEVNYKNKKLLIDACHNPDGARVLVDYIKKYHKNKKIKFIFGCLKNKEYKKILSKLFEIEAKFYFFEFNWQNALKYEEIKDFSPNFIQTKNPVFEIKQDDCELCVVSGSIYMLGEIFKNFNLTP